MTAYAALKLLHMLASTVRLRSGLGIAFFMWFTHRSGKIEAIAIAARLTVRADLLLTTPVMIIQPICGFLLMRLEGFHLYAPWRLIATVL